MNAFVAESIAVLERTPGVLLAWLRDLPGEWTEAREAPGTFSPRDVVGHLILGEDTDWIPRLRLILEKGDTQPFTPFDRFGFEAIVKDRPLHEIVGVFSEKRARNLDTLRGFGLTDADLQRPGRHPELGAVTLRQLLATWVVHDLNHLGQIARVMSRRHEAAVGPWKAYLGILR
jgi:hypothetical protein